MKNKLPQQLRRASDDLILADSLQIATTFGSRLRGLMARPELIAGSAFILDPCRSIHTCFMRFAIDVVYLDRHHVVTGVSCHVKPWCFRMAPEGTQIVVEMCAGLIAAKQIRVKDQLYIENNPETKLENEQ